MCLLFAHPGANIFFGFGDVQPPGPDMIFVAGRFASSQPPAVLPEDPGYLGTMTVSTGGVFIQVRSAKDSHSLHGIAWVPDSTHSSNRCPHSGQMKSYITIFMIPFRVVYTSINTINYWYKFIQAMFPREGGTHGNRERG